MNRIIYDVECLCNFFCVNLQDYDSNEQKVYEISERRNDIEEIVKDFNSFSYVIGFNSVSYDDRLINSLIKNADFYNKAKYNWKDITSELYKLSQLIIEDNNDNHKNYEKYKEYGWNKPFKSIDLFLFWSKMLRLSKKLSLKSISANIHWHNIQQMPVPHDVPLALEDIDKVIDYCWNDVFITKKLAILLKDQINLRVNIQKQYGIKCLSSDNIKIASDLLAKQYSEKTGIPEREFRERQTWRKDVALRDCILPQVEFNKTEVVYSFKQHHVTCNSYYSLLKHLLTRTVKTTKELSYHILTTNPNGTNLMVDIGSGGNHAICEGKIFETKENEVIIESDVKSLYPTLLSEWGFVPNQLEKGSFLELYKEVKRQRLEAKEKGDKIISEALKLVLNGVFGLFNNDYSWLKDMLPVLQITLNGQLLLCKLSELCQENGINVISLNTDSITALMTQDKKDIYFNILREIENIFRVEFEHTYYKKLVFQNINNYGGLQINGKIKQKSLFVEEPSIDQSHDFLIIPKALNNYFFRGIAVKDTLEQEKNIYLFTATPRAGKQYSVHYRGKRCHQNLNRFYASTDGAYLYKQKSNGNMEALLKEQPVIIFNTFEDKPMKDYNISYSYYEKEVQKLINELQPPQGKLF